MNGSRNDSKKRKFFDKNNGSRTNKQQHFNKNHTKLSGKEESQNEKFITEGDVRIKNKKEYLFYNKTQLFNRDMSIVLIKALEVFLKEKNKENDKVLFRGFNVVELLGGSGIRSLRYVKELENTINHITVNDIDPYVSRQIKRNFRRNEIPKNKYTVLCNDANSVMNIMNMDNMMNRKKNLKKLDVGFSYTNTCVDMNLYFKEATKFLHFLSSYNKIRGEKQTKQASNGEDSDSTAFSEEEKSVKEEVCNPTEEARNENTKEDTKVIDPAIEIEIEETMHIESILAKKKEMEKYIFDIIDIDPYGSSIEFLESCLKYGKSNFFILVTNTDMRILNGKYLDVSFYKYNSMLFGNKVYYNNEYSIRVLLYKIKSIASKYKKNIIPYMCLNIDFYIRMLIQVVEDPLQTKDFCIDTSMVYQCTNCCSFHISPMAQKINVPARGNTQRKNEKRKKKKNHKGEKEEDGLMDSLENIEGMDMNEKEETNHVQENEKEEDGEEVVDSEVDEGVCEDKNEKDSSSMNPNGVFKYKNSRLKISEICEECKESIIVGGPIYTGPLHNINFIKTAISVLEQLKTHNLHYIKTSERILINFRCLEQEINVPLYYNMAALFKIFKICAFSRRLIVNALKNLNYEVSYFHKDPDSIKTNAPNHVFMDVFRAIIFKINSRKKKDPTSSSFVPENEEQHEDAKLETKEKTKYSLETIHDEKLKEKLSENVFFKKGSTFDNVNMSYIQKNEKKCKLFTMVNPEPYWGPKQKHIKRN